MQDDQKKLKALATQLIRIPTGTIVKRGCSEMRIDGTGSTEVLERILSVAAVGASPLQICSYFPENYKAAVLALIEFLKVKNVLVPFELMTSPNKLEQPIDVFYWHFDSSESKITSRLQRRKIALVGVNTITHRLAVSLRTGGFSEVEIIDYLPFRGCHFSKDNGTSNQGTGHGNFEEPIPYGQWVGTLADREIDCLVSCSDFGGSIIMAEWNAFCIERRCHFFPIVLQDLIGYIGPLVIPRETACYECLISRENSHSKDWTIDRTIERSAVNGKEVMGFHPLMPSVAADIGAFELVKFYSETMPQRCTGRLIEVNLLAAKMTSRKVLKVPRCQCCSDLNIRSSVSPYKNLPDLEKKDNAIN